jgi:hypothetical protein
MAIFLIVQSQLMSVGGAPIGEPLWTNFTVDSAIEYGGSATAPGKLEGTTVVSRTSCSARNARESRRHRGIRGASARPGEYRHKAGHSSHGNDGPSTAAVGGGAIVGEQAGDPKHDMHAKSGDNMCDVDKLNARHQHAKSNELEQRQDAASQGNRDCSEDSRQGDDGRSCSRSDADKASASNGGGEGARARQDVCDAGTCTNHGTCAEGWCVCDAGWFGEFCDHNIEEHHVYLPHVHPAEAPWSCVQVRPVCVFRFVLGTGW